jgi:hypothetical protein
MILNKNAPFGTISGHLKECPNARYVQNGINFDNDGNLASKEEAQKAVKLLNKNAVDTARVAREAAKTATEMAEVATADANKMMAEAEALMASTDDGSEIDNDGDSEIGNDGDSEIGNDAMPVTVALLKDALKGMDVEFPKDLPKAGLKDLWTAATRLPDDEQL